MTPEIGPVSNKLSAMSNNETISFLNSPIFIKVTLVSVVMLIIFFQSNYMDFNLGRKEASAKLTRTILRERKEALEADS